MARAHDAWRRSLEPERVVPLLRGRLGRPYLYERSCESTQALLTDSLPEGACAVTELQSAGRGRLGRRWEAPAGAAVLVSVLLRPPPERPLPQLSLVAGLAAARAVESALGRPAQIKWPNDVLVDTRKVGGVLAEARGRAVAVGIGVNVNQTVEELPARTAFPATSLRAADGQARDRAGVLVSLLAELERAYDAWCTAGLRPLLPALRARDALLGLGVRAGTVAGVAGGLDDCGRLLVVDGTLTRTVESGEISLETAPASA
jgi:BirA family biotin operon repressor/biotin-[acetyl-CoA-carboxylase] ligase